MTKYCRYLVVGVGIGFSCLVSAQSSTLQTFVNTYNGKFVGDGQCVALAHLWAKTQGKDIPSMAYAYLYSQNNCPGYVFIKNTPTGVPQSGDLVVWAKSSALPYGHIAVFYKGNASTFQSFDQNWPLGKPCALVSHGYLAPPVAGWLHKL